MNESHLSPCYVLGIETQIGLTLIRELGEAGVPVIGIAFHKQAIGLASRYLKGWAILHTPRSDDGLAELRAIGERFGEGILLTISEANVSWLIANQDKLGNLKAVVPSSEAFAVVLDKTRTLEAAARVGIAVPTSACPGSWDDVERIAQEFPFPAVLKWSDPNAISQRLSAQGIELLKAEYVYSAEDYLRASERYRTVGIWPLAQEYCAGIGLGQFFFMHEGQAVRRFQHLRVAEWPPEGGVSSVCDGLPLDQFQALQEQSIELLREIGWEGVAMVEYRYDSIRDRAVLMEINGRFWGSYPLAAYSGAGFGLLTYFLKGLGRMPQLPFLRQNLRCRMVATELKRLRRILLEPELIMDHGYQRRPLHEIWRFVIDFLRPSVRYYVLNLKDIKPFIRDLRNIIRR